MVKSSKLKRKLAARARALEKLDKRYKIEAMKENLRCISDIIAIDDNLKELLIYKSKEDLKIVFTDVLTSVEFYNMLKISVDNISKADSEVILSNYAANDVHNDNNTSNFGKDDSVDY